MKEITPILITSAITLVLVALVYFLIKIKPLNSIKKFIKLMVSNGDEVSSKRVIALIAFALMVVSYTYGITTHTKIPEYMWEGFLFIVLSAFFGNVVEKFRRKNTNNDNFYNNNDFNNTDQNA
jgi:hypothetical protein